MTVSAVWDVTRNLIAKYYLTTFVSHILADIFRIIRTVICNVLALNGGNPHSQLQITLSKHTVVLTGSNGID